MSKADLFERLMLLIPLVLSLSVHEWAHAWSAFRLGDDTAERLGRLTLNPLAHIDPIGTVLLPLMGVPFGWAKPVPVNPVRFRRGVTMRTGMMITASAGPLANVALAIACTVLLGLFWRFASALLAHQPVIFIFLQHGIGLNLALAIFNLLPVPPLDGSRVADGLMPRRLRPAWEAFARRGPIVLLGLIILPGFLGFSVIGWPLQQAENLIDHLLRFVVG